MLGVGWKYAYAGKTVYRCNFPSLDINVCINKQWWRTYLRFAERRSACVLGETLQWADISTSQ